MMINWLDHVRDGITAVIAALVAAIVAAFGWLIRTVFTSQKKIEILEHDLARRNDERDEMRKDIAEVKDGVRRIEDVLLRDITGRL